MPPRTRRSAAVAAAALFADMQMDSDEEWEKEVDAEEEDQEIEDNDAEGDEEEMDEEQMASQKSRETCSGCLNLYRLRMMNQHRCLMLQRYRRRS